VNLTLETVREMFTGEYEPDWSVFVLIDTASGECRIADGEFDNFNWTPAWSKDGSCVVFGAPFQSRRLFSLSPDEMCLHTWKFRRNVVMPMHDVTGDVAFEPERRREQ
jgi:hypothetical protein